VNIKLFVALAAVAAVPLVWFVAGKLHRFAYWIGRKTDAEIQALATDGWQRERLAVGDGVELAGLARPPRAADARWILFAPGNSPNVLAASRGDLEQLRGERDLGFLVFAYRGFDASGGTPTPDALAADLLAQWRLLRGRGVPAARIELWGYSLGSILAARLAGELGAAEAPARLVLLATTTRIPVMRFGPLGRFFPDDVFELESALAAIRCPVAIVHGADDAALPIAGARDVRARLGERAVLHELPGVGHTGLWLQAAELLLPPATAR
jgi:pimeloyl-ACP methyl ester carboxylesterase